MNKNVYHVLTGRINKAKDLGTLNTIAASLKAGGKVLLSTGWDTFAR